MENRISIIVPVYNVEQFLEECIKSIVNQVYQDLEIILVNDGSTDRSGKLCDELAAADSRIIVFHQNNRGVSEARNTGLKLATGQYIGFVDSDDVLHPYMYEWMMRTMRKEKADVVICHEQAFEEKCSFRQMDCPHIERIENREQIFAHFMDAWSGPVNFLWNKLYQRKLFDGVRFPTGIELEDMYIQVEIMRKVSKVVWLTETLYGYRQRNDSIMNSGKDDIYFYWAEALMHQRKVIKEMNVAELSSRVDLYMQKTLNRLEYQAQKEGKKAIRKKLCQMYSKRIKSKMEWNKKSIRERVPIYFARFSWPLYYMCIRIADKRG